MVKIESIREESEGIRTFSFDVHPKFIPGQFVMLSAAINGETVKRAYSIASSPLDNNLELTIELIPGGKMTEHLFSLKPGDDVEVGNPMGKFIFRDDMESVCMLTGGTGITPMRSIIRYCTQKKLDTKLVLIYSSRCKEKILYREELGRLEKKNPNLNVIHTLTRDCPDDWNGGRGRINIEMIKGHCDIGGDFFLCGNAEMVKSLNSMLQEIGVDKARIRFDVW